MNYAALLADRQELTSRETQWETEQDQRTEEWTEVIEGIFDDLTRVNSVDSIALPCVKQGVLTHIPVADALDYAWDTNTAHKLAEILAKSQCPQVAELRKMLASNYAEAKADSLAEVAAP